MSVTIIRNNQQASLFAVFGSGLIGVELIRTASVLCAQAAQAKISFDWGSPEQVKGAVSQLMRFAKHNNIPRLEVFWCAGRAGFSASAQEMDNELSTFQAALSELERQKNISICFNLLSSAGGLYEGLSGTVSASLKPVPIRPYGKSKLEQEQILGASKLLHRIYRPTTVYGRARAGARQGLISTLINNTYNQVPTSIHASPDTLRDYVYVTDLAKIMVLNAFSYSQMGKAHIISCGRPVSIYYLLEKVRLVLGKRPRVNFIPSHGNDQNMSYSGNTMPNLFSLTSLEEGVWLLARQQLAV